MRNLFLLFAWGVAGLYTMATWRGFDPFQEKRGFIPPGQRQQAGGYRSYTYWRGGK